MNSSKVIVAGLLFVTIGSGCDYSLKRQASETPAGPQSFALSVTDLVVETSATATVANGEFQLLQNTTAQLGCELGVDGQEMTGAGETGTAINSFSNYLALRFSFPFLIKPSAVVLRLSGTGAPTASVVVDITEAVGAAPVMSNVLATSSVLPMSGVQTGSPSNQTFSFSSVPSLEASALYSLVLRGFNGSGSVDGSNNVAWSRGNDASDCSGFNAMQRSMNSGSTWSDLPTRPYFFFQVPGYAAEGTGYWIVDGGRERIWDLSTFMISENPAGDKAGVVSYSVGVGEDASTPTYSSTDLSLTQLQALSPLMGRYLYIRVKLSSSHSNFVSAGVASGSISGL
ncbi:MAG: hypothetical protein KUL82_08545 [Bdellovibrio sp.]|nr:hypothetical protein [Bdellovibrio sp.]